MMVWRALCYQVVRAPLLSGSKGPLKDVAEILVLFLCGAQLVLKCSILTIPCLNEVDVVLRNAGILG
jgi:hypothetical protein